MNNNCHCPILDEKEATKEAIEPWAPVTRQNQNEENSSKQIGQQQRTRGKEEDVADNPGGKFEQM